MTLALTEYTVFCHIQHIYSDVQRISTGSQKHVENAAAHIPSRAINTVFVLVAQLGMRVVAFRSNIQMIPKISLKKD